MKRREDGAVREVMKALLRSDLRFHKTNGGRFGAMTTWGLKDTSSRPAKDLGEPCGTRYERCCGVMTSAPAETYCVPIVRGVANVTKAEKYK